MSTTATEQEERFCRYLGIMCEYATEYGYCKITGCAKAHELYGTYKDGDTEKEQKTIPMFKESEKAYKAWTGEEIGGDEINEMNKEIIKDILKTIPTAYLLEALGVATFEELMKSAEAVPQSEQYKKGFEDAKRAFLIEYARESENMRKRNAQLEVMLNAQKAISARPQGEWIGLVECSVCGKQAIDFIDGYVDGVEYLPNFCPNCGADMRGDNGK